ncbi:hypothetical protein AC579_5198 [Pseudocercospora musae]|uniref:Uncharacterized protein n=1 Tax=Pseudocercospora musae TaxID=113226 RepID=A0A139IAX5_9PEZI|nr:hypothetical protein AC579_5198 [Pseudocercospora musae]
MKKATNAELPDKEILNVVPIDYEGECREPSGRNPYDPKNNKDPYKPYTVDLSEFLLELGAPRCFQDTRVDLQGGSDLERGQLKKQKHTGARAALSSMPEVGNRLVPKPSGSKVTQKVAQSPKTARSRYSMVSKIMVEAIDLTDE